MKRRYLPCLASAWLVLRTGPRRATRMEIPSLSPGEREEAPDVVVTGANNDPCPLFGDIGTYTVPGIYTIPPDVLEGTCY